MELRDSGKLIIGAYILTRNAQTERHIRELAQCGIDLVICLEPNDRGVLDLLYKYGIRCIVTRVLPVAYEKQESRGFLNDILPLSRYEEAAASFEDHPAIVGIDLCDEPTALDFDYLDRAATLCKKLFPGKLIYLNLFPNYAAVATNTEDIIKSSLGTSSYQEHIDRYVEKVGLDYISYDNYVYSHAKEKPGGMFDNFRIVADACLRTGRDFWYIPQVNTRFEDFDVTAGCLRWQAYIALAYGAKAINWACWCGGGMGVDENGKERWFGGWWEKNVLDENGEKTAQYDRLKEVNFELKRFWEHLRPYRRVDTRLVGFSSAPDFQSYPLLKPEERLDLGFVKELCGNGADLAVGVFVKDGSPSQRALLVANASDYKDLAPFTSKISFRSDCRGVKVFCESDPAALERWEDGTFSFSLNTCRAALVTFED